MTNKETTQVQTPTGKLSISKQRIIYFSILLVSILVDQLSKYWAVQSLKAYPGQDFLGGIFRLEYAENPGAFLGLGSQFDPEVRFWIFTIFVAIFLVYAIILLWRSKSLDSNSLGLCLLISGGVGNLIDRSLNHKVVDFMNMGIGSLRTGIFNVADFAIVVGMCFMLLGPHILDKYLKGSASHE